jgi:hypothetical protein
MTEPDNSGCVERDGDEISLVDLFAVLIRYRKIVIGVPVLVTLLAAAYLFLLPLTGVLEDKDDYLVRISVPVQPIPDILKGTIPFNTENALGAYLSSIQVHAADYGTFFADDVKSFDSVELNTFIRDVVLKERFSFTFEKSNDVCYLSMKSDDQEAARQYLFNLWSRASISVTARLHSVLANKLDDIENQLAAIGKASNLASEILMRSQGLNEAKQNILSVQSIPLYPFGDEPFTVVTLVDGLGNKRSKTMVLVFFASSFLGILAAFVMHYVATIRHDPEAMETLRKAWRG